jgi:hypothetical protein
MLLENELAEKVRDDVEDSIVESRVPPDATEAEITVASGGTLDSATCSANSFSRTIAG